MKINFNGTIKKDGKEWKVWTVVIISSAKFTYFYERHECENNFKWFFDKHEIFGEPRKNMETRFAKLMLNREKDNTFQVDETFIEIDIDGKEPEYCRMRFKRSVYEKKKDKWYLNDKESPIGFKLDEMLHYAQQNNLIGQVIRVSDLNKERIVDL